MLYQNERYLRLLRDWEGKISDGHGRHKAYHCPAGKLTIGYGHNLESNPISGLGENSTISDAEAEELLRNDVRACEVSVDGALPWAARLDEVRHAVLVDMAFNMGVAGLLKFRTTLGHVLHGRYAEAADAMMQSKWAGQVGRRARADAQMMRTGLWPEEND